MILIPTLAALVMFPVQGKLVVKDLVVGKGAASKAGDTLTVEYKGSLTTGKVFDSNYGKAPFTFTLGAKQVIEGWEQGMRGMKVGGKRMLTIPPNLGYGSRDMGDIPPNSTLKFEVKLLHIKAKGAPIKIQIQELKPGKGRAAKDGDSVQVHYKGTLLNGVKFDSSYDRKQTLPVTIGTGGVIPGFDQALRGMKVGQKRRVTIPPELGYGSQGAGEMIPPNATLIFELEMVKIGK